MIRLFAALEIPFEIRRLITEERKKIFEGEMKWMPEDKLHLTLKFIGNFSEKNLDELKGELSFIENYKKFEMRLTNFGFFFNRKIPRILWIGLSVNNNLFNLVDDLNKHLVKFKIPVEEKKFKPHLTILRITKEPGESFVQLFRESEALDKSFESDKVILYKSELSPEGSRYTPLKIYNLKQQDYHEHER
jgi:RNA 2',3'-cyclic 3'-phosphodiesterase